MGQMNGPRLLRKAVLLYYRKKGAFVAEIRRQIYRHLYFVSAKRISI